VSNYYKITRHNKQVGKIQLVYYNKNKIPHLEYEIDDNYRSKGIMSKELKKYLSRLREEGIERFIAIVEKDNLASVKLLEDNYFARMWVSDDYYYYLGVFDIIDQLFEIRKQSLKQIKKVLKNDL